MGTKYLTCKSRTDTTYGACMTAPVWFSANPAALSDKPAFYPRNNQQNGGRKVYGEHRMFINNKTFVFASYVSGGDNLPAWNSAPLF